MKRILAVRRSTSG